MRTLIYAIMNCGSKVFLKSVDRDFDVQKWANERKEVFRLLGVKILETEDVG